MIVRRAQRIGAALLSACAFISGCGKQHGVPVETVQVQPITSREWVQTVHDSGAKAVLVNMWAT